jgi:hypothetical protein
MVDCSVRLNLGRTLMEAGLCVNVVVGSSVNLFCCHSAFSFQSLINSSDYSVSQRFQLTTLHMHLPLAARDKIIRDRIRFSSGAGHKPRCWRTSLQLRDRNAGYKFLKKLEAVRSRVGCVVRVDSYRALVDVINCGSPGTSLNVHGLPTRISTGPELQRKSLIQFAVSL